MVWRIDPIKIMSANFTDFADLHADLDRVLLQGSLAVV